MSNHALQILLNPSNFGQIDPKDQNADLAFLAVKLDTNVFKIVPEKCQTNLVCEEALKNDVFMLKYIHNPTQFHYKTAILYSGMERSNLSFLLETIKELDMDLDVVIYIVKYINTDNIRKWLNKFPLKAWTESIIAAVIPQQRTNVFIKFLQENNIPLSHRIKNEIIGLYTKNLRYRLLIDLLERDINLNGRIDSETIILYNFLEKCDFSEFTEDDVKQHLIKTEGWYLPNDLKQRWERRLEFTLTEFCMCPYSKLALALCKTPTPEMIILSGSQNMWSTIVHCLERKILTGQILADIVQAGTGTITIEDIRSKGFQETLNTIEITNHQAEIIKTKHDALYQYLWLHNIYLKTYARVVILDLTTKPKGNEIMFSWNLNNEVDKLKEGYGDTITIKIKNLSYKLYTTTANKGTTCIRTVIVLNN